MNPLAINNHTLMYVENAMDRIPDYLDILEGYFLGEEIAYVWGIANEIRYYENIFPII
jgi:hypothetical protein